MYKLSIVVPCFCEEQAIPLFYQAINKISQELKECSLEVIFIDDGSTDNTLQVIKILSNKDDRVKYLSFSRNFGKEAAIFAGLKSSTSEYVLVMDVDLQDSPDLIPDMLYYIREEGYDCVSTRRVDRKGEPPIRSFFARCFYQLINHISKVDFVDGARDFRMITRQVVDAILELQEYNRFSKGIFEWVGFKNKRLEVKNSIRSAGETKWSVWKLLIYSFEGIIAFSTLPLAIASISGVLFCLVSFIMICVIIGKTLIFGDPVAGWPSLACIIFLVGGVQLFCTGIVGQYLAKTYLETKNRPIYIIREKN